MHTFGQTTRDPAAAAATANMCQQPLVLPLISLADDHSHRCHKCAISSTTTTMTATSTGSQYLISSSGLILELQHDYNNHHRHHHHELQRQHQPHHPDPDPHELLRTFRNYHHHPIDHKHHLVLLCLVLVMALSRRRRVRGRNVNSPPEASESCLERVYRAIIELLVLAVRDAYCALGYGKLLNGVDTRPKSAHEACSRLVHRRRLATTNNGKQTTSGQEERTAKFNADKGQAEQVCDGVTTRVANKIWRRDFQRDKQVEIAIIVCQARGASGDTRPKRDNGRGLASARVDCDQRRRGSRSNVPHALRLMVTLVAALCWCCSGGGMAGASQTTQPGHVHQILEDGNWTQSSDSQQNQSVQFLQPRIEDDDEDGAVNSTAGIGRKNFGQRLLGVIGGQRAANSLLARTLRHLNGTAATVPLAVANSKSSASNSSSHSIRDYETTQLIGRDDTLISNPHSSLARPNLTLDTWAKLINLRNMNSASGAHHVGLRLPAAIVGSAEHSHQTADRSTSATPTSELSWNSANSSEQHLTPGSLRRSATSGGARVLSIPHPSAGGAQESFSIGIVIKPHSPSGGPVADDLHRRLTTGRPDATGSGEQQVDYQLDSPSSVSAPTTAAAAASSSSQLSNVTTTTSTSRSSFGSPDWQASNEIEQVIRVEDDAETGTGSKESSEARGNKQGYQSGEKQGANLKGHEEKGHWSRERAGEEQREGAEKRAGKKEDKRLVDLGHNKHGWKNVYHREEYAQHQKYHDIFRDKDWHDKREKIGEQRAWQDGSKFNDSLSKNYLDKSKHGTKYDYRKGNEWKRSEEVDGETGAADETTTTSHRDQEQDGQVGSGQHKRVHLMSGSSAREIVEPNDDGDEQSDDFILEQMKARLEDMSRQHGDGDGDGARGARVAAGSGQYELRSAPPPVTNQQVPASRARNESGWSEDGARRREFRNNNMEGNNLLSGQQTRGLEFVRPVENSHNHEENDAIGEDNDDQHNYFVKQQQQQHGHAPLHHHDHDHHNRDHHGEVGKLAAATTTTHAPAQPAARSEDKRNELRLKLELDLGKSTATNHLAAGGSRTAAAGSVEPTDSGEHSGAPGGGRRNFTATPTHTNSLGQAIGYYPAPPSPPQPQKPNVGRSRDAAKQQQQQQQPPRKQLGQFDLDNAKHHNNNSKLGANKQWGDKYELTNNNNNIGDNNKSSILAGKYQHRQANKWPGQFHDSNNNYNKSFYYHHGPPPPPPPELHSIVPTHSFSPMLSEDLTVENSLGGLGEDHELTLAGARSAFDQSQKGPSPTTSHREYMLMFGIGAGGDEHDHHVTAGSDHYHRQVPTGVGPQQPLDFNPNVMFEASGSELYDDYYHLGDGPRRQPPRERNSGDRQTMSEFLNSDYSSPRLNFASPSNYGLVAEASNFPVDDESDLFADSDGPDESPFNSYQQTSVVSTSGKVGSTQAITEPFYNYIPSQLQQRQILQLLNSGAQQSSRPVMASLRDHMNLLPLGNLLRVASSINQVAGNVPLSATGYPSQAPLASSGQPPGIMGTQFAQQQQQQHMLGSAASAPFGRWLRLPRVIESQIQQQRLKRQRQLAEQVAATAAAATTSSQWQPIQATGKQHIATTQNEQTLKYSKLPTSGGGGFIEHQVAFQKLYPGGPVDYNRLLEKASNLNYNLAASSPHDPMQAEQTSLKATHVTIRGSANSPSEKRKRKKGRDHNLQLATLDQSQTLHSEKMGRHSHYSNATKLHSSSGRINFSDKKQQQQQHHDYPSRQYGGSTRSTSSISFNGPHARHVESSSSTRAGTSDKTFEAAAAASMQRPRHVLPPSRITPIVMNHRNPFEQHRSSPPPPPPLGSPGSLIILGDRQRSHRTSGARRQLDFLTNTTTKQPHHMATKARALKPYLISPGNYKGHKDSTTSMRLRDSDKQQQQQALVGSNQVTTSMKTTISSLGERLFDNLKISKLIPNG